MSKVGTIEDIRTWKCSDGSIHEERYDAIQHEMRLEIREFFAEHINACSTEDDEVLDMLMEAIKDNWSSFNCIVSKDVEDY